MGIFDNDDDKFQFTAGGLVVFYSPREMLENTKKELLEESLFEYIDYLHNDIGMTWLERREFAKKAEHILKNLDIL